MPTISIYIKDEEYVKFKQLDKVQQSVLNHTASDLYSIMLESGVEKYKERNKLIEFIDKKIMKRIRENTK